MLKLGMFSENAKILLDNSTMGRRLFGSRSPITTEIVLTLAMHDNGLDLRDLLKSIDATPIATRQHLENLMQQGFVTMSLHPKSKRCKVVALTDAAIAALRQYELQFQSQISEWRNAQNS